MGQRLKKPLVVVLILLAVLLFGCETIPAASYRVGSSGEPVREIQRRLKDWGYYFGAVDGKYGAQTRDAVIRFQKKHRITADGIVGAQTAEKLGVAAPKGSSAAGNNSDVYLLARLIYGEARGEPYKGMVAVGAVVLNRVRSSEFPGTMAKVIYQRGAFDVVDDGQINLAPDQQSLDAARDAMNGWDPSGGALFYYAPRKTTNQWIRQRQVITTIGDHVFAK